REVTLVTGDRVLLTTDAAGRVSASFTPGSPDFGRPVHTLSMSGHTYVVPQLPLRLRRKLDMSVFDVSALTGGRVTLDVTFRRGPEPRSLPGLSLRTSTARRTGHGATRVAATYDASRALPASLTRSLGPVSQIAVQGVSTVNAAPGYELHTLTINATNVAD